MKKITLPILTLAIGAMLLYGLWFKPFGEEVAEGEQPQKTGSKAQPVEIGRVERGSVDDKISSVGSFVANRAVNVAPKINGRLMSVLVDVGDRVRAGQLIAQLDQRQLAEEVRDAEASLRVAEATLKGKQAELQDLNKKMQRSKTLYQKNFISRQDVDTLDSQVAAAAAEVELAKARIAQMKARLENARIQVGETKVAAPFAGYVEKRLVDPGALVNAGNPIVGIVDISRVKVMIPVVERDYPKILTGQAASVVCEAYPGRRFQGKVARKTPALSQETRTGEVEIEVDNAGGFLKPGMFARVDIVLNQRRDVLLVPEAALVKAGETYVVFRVDGSGAVVKRVPVTVGSSRDGGRIEVQGELKVSDKVVTLGRGLLKDGQRVKFSEQEQRERNHGPGA